MHVCATSHGEEDRSYKAEKMSVSPHDFPGGSHAHKRDVCVCEPWQSSRSDVTRHVPGLKDAGASTATCAGWSSAYTGGCGGVGGAGGGADSACACLVPGPGTARAAAARLDTVWIRVGALSIRARCECKGGGNMRQATQDAGGRWQEVTGQRGCYGWGSRRAQPLSRTLTTSHAPQAARVLCAGPSPPIESSHPDGQA